MMRKLLVGVALLASAESAVGQEPHAPVPLPELHWRSDGILGAASLAGILIGLELPVTRRDVPAQGLDPSTIGWKIDRDIVGHPSTSADNASDVFLLATVLAPPVLALATQPGVHGLDRIPAAGRALRPIAAAGRGLRSAPQAGRRSRAAVHLPAGIGAAERRELRRHHQGRVRVHAVRPLRARLCRRVLRGDGQPAGAAQAGTAEHVAVASIGALLAGFTGNLRVRADQHFPTDALVGSLIGTASGVSVPMLHHYLLPDGRRVPHPGRSCLADECGWVCGGGGAGRGALESGVLDSFGSVSRYPAFATLATYPA